LFVFWGLVVVAKDVTKDEMQFRTIEILVSLWKLRTDVVYGQKS